MPAFVDRVGEELDQLTPSEAEDIWEEVKQSLEEDGEVPEEDSQKDGQDWGLITQAFKKTLVSRFDGISMSDLENLSESVVKSYIKGNISVEEFLEHIK